MQERVLEAQPRSSRKKGPARRMRRAGRIPAVIYGHSEPTAISVDAREFHNLFRHITESTIITLKADGEDVEVLIKDYDEDLRTNQIKHIDFYAIEAGTLLRTHLGIHLTGSPKGVREGGVLEQQLHDLEIECLPKDIPESITIDVTDLEIGDSVHVSDIPKSEGVTFLTGEEYVVALVAATREEVEEEPEEELEGEEAMAEEGAEGETDADESEESEG